MKVQQLLMWALLKCRLVTPAEILHQSIRGKQQWTIILLVAWQIVPLLNQCWTQRIKAGCVFSIKGMQMKLDMCCAYRSASGQLPRRLYFQLHNIINPSREVLINWALVPAISVGLVVHHSWQDLIWNRLLHLPLCSAVLITYFYTTKESLRNYDRIKTWRIHPSIIFGWCKQQIF